MKFTCEICGCHMTNMDEMARHESKCRDDHQTLINCTAEINVLTSLAEVTPFGLVVEVPYVEVTESKDEKSSEATEIKFKYLPVKAAELRGNENRCTIILKYDDNDIKPAAKNTVKNKTK